VSVEPYWDLMEADQARYWRVAAGERWSFSRVLVAGWGRRSQRVVCAAGYCCCLLLLFLGEWWERTDDFLELGPGDGVPVFVFD